VRKIFAFRMILLSLTLAAHHLTFSGKPLTAALANEESFSSIESCDELKRSPKLLNPKSYVSLFKTT